MPPPLTRCAGSPPLGQSAAPAAWRSYLGFVTPSAPAELYQRSMVTVGVIVLSIGWSAPPPTLVPLPGPPWQPSQSAALVPATLSIASRWSELSAPPFVTDALWTEWQVWQPIWSVAVTVEVVNGAPALLWNLPPRDHACGSATAVVRSASGVPLKVPVPLLV